MRAELGEIRVLVLGTQLGSLPRRFCQDRAPAIDDEALLDNFPIGASRFFNFEDAGVSNTVAPFGNGLEMAEMAALVSRGSRR